MKKKRFSLVLAFALMLSLLASCGQQAAPSSDASPTPDNAPSASDEVYTIKFAHDGVENTPYYYAGLEFKRILEEKSNGRIQVEVYGNGQLGSEPELLEAARMGVVDVACCGSANASTVLPSLSLFSVSYLFKNDAHFDACIYNDSPIVERVKQLVTDANVGVQVGAILTVGCRTVCSKTPVRTPADMKGLKMRVMPSDTEVKVWSTVGALPTSIATSEVYSALETGVVSVTENSPAYLYSYKYYEPAPYICLTQHQYLVSYAMVSDAAAKKLPEDLQKVFWEALDEVGVYERAKDRELDVEALEKLKAEATVIEDVDKQAFMDLLSPMQDEVAGKLGVQDILEMIRNTKA